MLSRARNYWGSSNAQLTEEKSNGLKATNTNLNNVVDNSNNNNKKNSNENEKIKTKHFKTMEGNQSLQDISPYSTTTTSSEHPCPLLHAQNHMYSLSTPLLTSVSNNNYNNEKLKDFKQSMHYTFDPIQYHYFNFYKKQILNNNNNNNNDNDNNNNDPKKIIISHSVPISLTFHSTSLSSSSLTNLFFEPNRTNTINLTEKDGNTNENNEAIITRYLNSLSLTSEEKKKKNLFELHEWIIHDTLSNKMKEELCLGDMVTSYFSSFSRNNPDAKGCWKRWISYRNDSPCKDVNFHRVKEFFATGFFNVGYDKENRPVFIINTKYYDDSFGPEITAKATILFVTSLLWNIRDNYFDMDALRKGVCIYADLSHYSINMLAWNVIQACKSALISFPFQLLNIYCVNTPTFVYILRQVASKILVPHAMEKLKILGDTDEYFEKYGVREKTPVQNGGSWKMTTIEWMRERGFIDDE